MRSCVDIGMKRLKTNYLEQVVRTFSGLTASTTRALHRLWMWSRIQSTGLTENALIISLVMLWLLLISMASP